MEGNSKSWKNKFIFILIMVALIKCGSSAPRTSRLENIPPKTKRSAGYINYLNSMFYDSSFNYPTYNWNPYPYVPAQPVYETSFIQYPDNNRINGNIDTILSIDYNWPEHEMQAINPFKDVSENFNDRALILTNVGKDDSFTYILENDCDYDLPSATNDINWNFPPQGLDESVFHNFYLVPDQTMESAPTTTTRPIEPPVQHLNKDKEDVSPNISIFNCISDPGQKDIIEKALSSKDEEYMVLLIKKNQFLGGKKQDTTTETMLQQPLNNPIEPETTTFLPSTVGDQVVILNEVSDSENEIVGSPTTIESIGSGIHGIDLKEISEKEILIPTVTASTSLATQEHVIKTTIKEEDRTNLVIPVVDLDLDLKEIAEEENVLPFSTISSTISTQEHDVKPPEILVEEEVLTNPGSLQGEGIVVIVEEKPTNTVENEVIVDIPEIIANTVENPIPLVPQTVKVETAESIDLVKSIAEETRKLDNDPLDIHTKEEKVYLESEVRQELPPENPESIPTQAEVQISKTLIEESKIIEDAPSSIIASTLPDIIKTDSTDNTVMTEKPLIIQDGTVKIPSIISTVVEDQNIPIKSMDTSTTEEPNKDLESIALPIDVLKTDEIDFDSSPSTSKPVEVTTLVLQTALEEIDLTNKDTGTGSVDPEV